MKVIQAFCCYTAFFHVPTVFILFPFLYPEHTQLSMIPPHLLPPQPLTSLGSFHDIQARNLRPANEEKVANRSL